jgi:hypothetical protein
LQLRDELLADIPSRELRICMRVLTQIRKKAEARNGIARAIRNGDRVPIEGNGKR